MGSHTVEVLLPRLERVLGVDGNAEVEVDGLTVRLGDLADGLGAVEFGEIRRQVAPGDLRRRPEQRAALRLAVVARRRDASTPARAR